MRFTFENTKWRGLLVLLVVCFGIRAFAAEEVVEASLKSGSNNSANNGYCASLQPSATILIYENNTGNPQFVASTFNNLLRYKQQDVYVRLRFDDLKKKFVYDFDLTVEYDLKVTDINGQITNYIGRSINIAIKNSALPANIGASVNSNDITQTLVSLSDLQSPFVTAELTVTNIIFTPLTGAAIPFTSLSDYADVFLDLGIKSEKHYSFDPAVAAAPQTASGFLFNQTSGYTNLPLAWDYIAGAESYDLEWLFIDAGTASFGTTTLDFDFINATRINLKDNFYEIPLAYPRGIILYRVRPVGFVYDTATQTFIRTEGAWSFATEAGTTTANAPSVNTNNRYDFDGLETGKNWQYAATYVEEGKRKEVISFYDGILNNRQTVTLLNTENNAVVGESVYDYEGRPSLQVVPVPLQSQGIKFYSAFNPNYTSANFDLDTKLFTPDPLDANAKSNIYHSSTGATLNVANFYNAYVPEANGYAYMRTYYTTDGTGRVQALSGAGNAFKMGSGHETQYFYGMPDQVELDRLFGNEVGKNVHYTKTISVDPNGQPSVTYADISGKTIATALAGDATANLLDIDNRPQAATLTSNILTTNTVGIGAVINTHNFTVSSLGTPYVFEYSMNGVYSCPQCIHVAPGEDPCTGCIYDLDFVLLDQNGDSPASTGAGSLSNPIATVSPSTAPTYTTTNSISYEGIDGVNVQFSVTFTKLGSYTLTKTLTPNQVSIDSKVEEYKIAEMLDPNCVNYPLIQPVPCAVAFDCGGVCDAAYTIMVDGQKHYLDANGVDQGTAPTQAYLDCITACNNEVTSSGSTDNRCDLVLASLKTDMSPGGQYFNNTMDLFILDANNQPVNNPSYDNLAWLNANIDPANNQAVFDDLNDVYDIKYPGNSLTITTWAEVRDNWIPEFTDKLYLKHPEYGAWVYFCEGDIKCQSFEPAPPSSSFCNSVTPGLGRISTFNDFEEVLMNTDYTTANSSGNYYFNPLLLSINTTTNPTTSGELTDITTPGNSRADYINYTANSDYTDPMLCPSCALNIACTTDVSANTIIKEFMQKYLKVGTTGNYLSVWYVINNPVNLHTIDASTLTPNSVELQIVNYMKSLHGDPQNTTSPYLLHTDEDKWNFFRNYYFFLRNLIIYQQYGNALPAPLTGTVSLIHSDPTVHYTANPVFDQILTATNQLCEIADGMSDLAASYNTGGSNDPTPGFNVQCSTSCVGYADSWIAQIEQTCASLSVEQKADIRTWLINVCAHNCAADYPEGSSGCVQGQPGCTAVTYTDPQTQTQYDFYDFDDVINHFSVGTCTATVVHPPNDADPVNDPFACACGTLNQYKQEYPLTSGSYGAYTSTAVDSWTGICNTAGNDLADLTAAGFPNELVCTSPAPVYNDVSCTCERIKGFLEDAGFNVDNLVMYVQNDPATPLGTATSFSLALAAIHHYFAPLQQGTNAMTEADLDDILTQCSATPAPAYSFFAAKHIPYYLICIPLGPSEEVNFQLQQVELCNQEQLDGAVSGSVTAYNIQLENNLEAYEAELIAECLSNAPANETFTKQYSLDEYYYTLYYYDQAGNLIKTVPPEGVNVITSAAVLANVATHRENPSGPVPFQYPEHRMVTNYKYNTFNNLIEQTSPDGGLSYFWYDYLGRMIFSQNAKQRAYTIPAYSYTRYDVLGRITEVGEFATANAAPTNDGTISKIALPQYPLTQPDNTFNANYALNTFMGAIIPTQVTRTKYDAGTITNTSNPLYNKQENLRNRVSSVEIDDDGNGTPEHSSFFTYDIHGNVSTLVNEFNYTTSTAAPVLPAGFSPFTKIDYTFDLFSGKVNSVAYQPNTREAMYHKYAYDADNRITHVFTSRDNVIWENDAKYFYYAHGPLARTEIGDKQVQGMDYAYTLQGWIKGVNGNLHSRENDMGQDAWLPDAVNNQNEFFNKDASGYTLGYFKGDYTPISNAVTTQNRRFEGLVDQALSPSVFTNSITDLFNGNIAYMSSAIQAPVSGGHKPDCAVETGTHPLDPLLKIQGAVYRYDQLNRIRNANWYTDAGLLTNKAWAGGTALTNYSEEFHYDFNGNITNAVRNGYAMVANGGVLSCTAVNIDNLSYRYNAPQLTQGKKLHNKLLGVNDAVTANHGVLDQGLISEDTGDMNYRYDAIGNLKSDVQEQIEEIAWTVYGKIKSITRISTSTKPDLEFKYDASGNRICKIVKNKLANGSLKPAEEWDYTLYQRDAQGNVMAVYEHNWNNSIENQEYKLSELNIYGSARLGIIKPNIVISGLPPGPVAEYRRTLGLKQFEISNHLGNVLTLISDKKVPVQKTVETILFERNFDNGDVSSTSLDVAGGTIINGEYKITPYVNYAGINIGYPTVPGEQHTISFDVNLNTTTPNDAFTATLYTLNNGQYSNVIHNPLTSSGHYSFNYVPQLNQATTKLYYTSGANVPNHSFIFDNFKVTTQLLTQDVDYYLADVISAMDYNCFGGLQSLRNYNAGEARRQFNGKETDPETGTQDYGMRIYNPEIGKFLSVDPISDKYPELTPYQFASNMPINSIDRDGLEGDCAICDRAERADAQYVKDMSMSKAEGDNYIREGKIARGLGGVIAGALLIDIYITKGKLTQIITAYQIGNAVDYSEKSYHAKKQGDYGKSYYYSTKSKENFLGAALGYAAGKALYYGFKAFSKHVATGLSKEADALTKNSDIGIVSADAEGLQYLEYQKAEAVYFATENGKGFMLIRPGANRATVLEELIHHNQKLQYGEKYFFENQAKIEVEAQNILLEVGKKEGWGAAELERIERAKKVWQEKAGG